MSLPISMPGQGIPSLALTDIIERGLRVAAQHLDVRLCLLTRIEGNTVTVCSVVDRQNTMEPGIVFPFSDSFCRYMLKTGQTMIPDTEVAQPEVRRLPSTVEFDLRSYIGIPVVLREGQIYGGLWAADSEPRQWTSEQLETLAVFARLLSHELSLDLQARSAERAEQFDGGPRSVDRVTGLMTRVAFESQARAEERRQRRYGGFYSVAVLELEDYSEVGKLHGHPVADQLLQGLASTLMLNSRIVDCYAASDAWRRSELYHWHSR
jgi:GAF domain-containing protein